MSWASGRNIKGSYDDVVSHPETRAYLLTELQAAGKAGRLKGFEVVKAIHTDPVQFTVDNDLITPTFKLKRAQLQKHYQAELDLMYKQINAAAEAKARLSKVANGFA